jgi:hypothetical protein
METDIDDTLATGCINPSASPAVAVFFCGGQNLLHSLGLGPGGGTKKSSPGPPRGAMKTAHVVLDRGHCYLCHEVVVTD